LEGGIGQLTKEISTNLTLMLSEEDHHMLAQLKMIQVELASEIQSQTKVVAKVSLECQKLQSFLKDNLMMRHQELLDEGVSVEGDACRRGQGGATTQKQRREDLEQRQHELQYVQQ
jgi:hypothetical protein